MEATEASVEATEAFVEGTEAPLEGTGASLSPGACFFTGKKTPLRGTHLPNNKGWGVQGLLICQGHVFSQKKTSLRGTHLPNNKGWGGGTPH